LSSKDKQVILITGPPGNGRDEYLQEALPKFEKQAKLGYYHIFDYMQKTASSHGVPHLTRENVFDIAKATLERIRDSAFAKVTYEVSESQNEIDIISTPAVFKVTPWGDYFTGKVNGITLDHIKQLKPTKIIVFIDDLLRVREQMRKDPLRKRMRLALRDLADWRESAIEMVQDYVDKRAYSETLDWIIFPKEHPVKTFVDLLVGQKPRIYLSYHITGQEDFKDVQRFMEKLCDSFVCIDPYTIKDWDIVTTYDEALVQKKKKLTIRVNYRDGVKTFSDIPVQEVEDAIDLIRTQIVQRDFLIIANVHATVVYHRSENPSYGVMAEVIHSVTRVNRPVYVLYPFETRPSPFFEHFVKHENIVFGNGAIESLEDEMIEKLESDCKDWPTIVS